MYLQICILVFVNSALAGNTNRIIGGDDAFVAEHPYQAAIYLNASGSKGFYCGAAIISQRHLLTTAYCAKTKPKALSVVIGEDFIPNYYDPQWLDKRAYQVQNITIHPEYDFSYYEPGNDIAILTVDRDMELNGKFAKAIALSNGSVPTAGAVAVVSGFGKSALPTIASLNEQKYVYVHLKSTSVPIVDNNVCKHRPDLVNKMSEDKICAGTEKDRGACVDDDGGPLVIDGYLIGLVSNDWNCKYGVGLYTDVYQQREFINQFINVNLEP